MQDKIKLVAIQRFEFEGKIYSSGETSYQIKRVAKRWVSRGIAKYAEIDTKIDAVITDRHLEHSKVSVVVMIIEEIEVFTKCLKSLKKHTDNYELIVISNGSSKETLKFLDSIDWIDFTFVKNKENKGIPYAWNQGVKLAKHDYICFLNSDTIVTPNWLDKLMKCFKDNKDCGICGPTTSHCGGLQCDRRVRESRFEMTLDQINKFASSLKDGYRQQEVMGFCFVVKREVFEKVGVFDYKRFKLGNTEEREFIWRADKLGNYKSYWVKGAYVHHYGHITFKELGIDPYTYNIEARREWDKNKHLVESKFIENDVELGTIKQINIDINKNKIIIMTANIGQYDDVMEKHFYHPNYQFVLFTDDKNLKSSFWKVIYVKRKFEDSRRESRIYKWLPHKFFPNAKYSLWIDSNILIKTDINILIEKYLDSADIAMHPHRARNCLYKEAKVCIDLKYDYVDIMKKQIEKYRLEGYPENNGLFENTVILRRHTKNIEKLNEAVWSEISTGSTRDQLCFNYIAWKLDIKVNSLSGTLDQKNLYFKRVVHKLNTRQYLKEVEITNNEKIDVIIPVLDRPKETIKTISSLFSNNRDINIIIVDNGSDDLNYLDTFNVKIIKNNKNLGVTKALNQGLAIAKSKYIVLMHNDIEINSKNWIDKAIKFMKVNKDVGMVGAAGWKRLGKSGLRKQNDFITAIDVYKSFAKPKADFEEVVITDGCCNVVKNIGLKFDEHYGYMHYYDFDLCMQYREKGYKIYVMNGSAIHFADVRNLSTIGAEKYKNLIKKRDIDYRKERNRIFLKKWKNNLPINVK